MMTPVRSIGLSFYCLSGVCTVAGRTSESSCVICSSGLTSPLSSAVMWSRTNSNSARFSLAIGSAGSDGIFKVGNAVVVVGFADDADKVRFGQVEKEKAGSLLCVGIKRDVRAGNISIIR